MKHVIFYFFIFILSLRSQSFQDKNIDHVEYESISSLKRGYKSYRSNDFFLKKISERYDFVNYYSLGVTKKNNLNISAVKLTSNNFNDNKISVFFNCSHHADEVASTEHCYDIIYQIIENNEKYKIHLDSLNIWIVPVVNPEGSKIFWEQDLHKGRKNFMNVDINRNYPFMWGIGGGSSTDINSDIYRGNLSASEIETQSIINLAQMHNFLFSVSYHAEGKKLLIPYTNDISINPSENYPKLFGEKIAKKINYLALKNLYPVNGTDQDFFYFKYGTIAFLLESEKRKPQYSRIEAIVKNSEKLWQEILYESVFGNKIYLKIVNEDDQPISANIEIKEIKFYNGEKHYSSQFNGLFNRMVLNENYTININKENYEKQSLRIKATKNNEIKIIKMKKIVP